MRLANIQLMAFRNTEKQHRLQSFNASGRKSTCQLSNRGSALIMNTEQGIKLTSGSVRRMVFYSFVLIRPMPVVTLSS